MIRRLLLRWRLERALAARRHARVAYAIAARRAAATEVRNRYARDRMVGIAAMREGRR